MAMFQELLHRLGDFQGPVATTIYQLTPPDLFC